MEDYVTKDLGEAAALLTYGCIMGDMQWKDGKAYFLFKEALKCTPISHQYFFEGLSLNVRVYYDNLKMIKRRLYNDKNRKYIRVTR